MCLYLSICLFITSGICLAQAPDVDPSETIRTGGDNIEQQFRLWDTWSRRPAREIVLSAEQRVDGLTRLWSEVKTEFVYFDRVPWLDWDSVYRATLPIVTAPQSPADYYRTLQSLTALLRDGSTRVIVPWELRDTLEIYPPSPV